MKIVIAIALLAFSYGCSSEELLRVESSSNNGCAEFGCMYDEWKLKSDESIRFVMCGYEDGVDSRFYKVDPKGSYSIILDVIPIIQDDDEKYWWGYASDLIDIPLEYNNGKLNILATFEHDQLRDGNFSPPEWQQSFPVVLFEGRKMGWNSEQPKYKYQFLSIQSLAYQARQLTRQ